MKITVEVRKLAKIKNRYNQVPHQTKDITWESDKNTIKHHKLKPRGQPIPADDHKAAINRRKSMTNANINKTMIHKRRIASERLVKLESLNQFHGANLTLSADVDQDT